MFIWIVWGILLILQNAAHTATSRARNSKGTKGLWYNGIASIFSNGVWMASQIFIVNMLVAVTPKAWQVKDVPGNDGESLTGFFIVLVFYITLTAFGSVMSQVIMQRMEAKRGIEHG